MLNSEFDPGIFNVSPLDLNMFSSYEISKPAIDIIMDKYSLTKFDLYKALAQIDNLDGGKRFSDYSFALVLARQDEYVRKDFCKDFFNSIKWEYPGKTFRLERN